MDRKEKVLYKVVGKEHRYGTNMTGYMCNKNLDAKEVEKFLESIPELKPFFPRYKKNSVVKAAPGSVGLLCFEDREFAEAFIARYPESLTKAGTIIKVKPLAKCKRARDWKIIRSCMSIKNLLDGHADMYAPSGTVAVDKLKVLE